MNTHRISTIHSHSLAAGKKKYILFIFYCVQSAFCLAQTKKVELLHANSLEFDESIGKEVKRLIGNVSLKHENALMYCDSAYLYPNNAIDAFSNVSIRQGDSVNIYSQFLKYNGNTRMAELRKEVRFVQKNTTLQTELLFYDMKTSMANYPNGGTIISKQNTLTSQYGYFNTKKNIYSFKKNVTLTNPNYVMTCDTLNYFSGTNTAYFLGPTEIKNANNYIYCESGWYNTDNDMAQFSKNAYIITGKQKMKGDTIFYDKTKDIGKAFGNVALIDTAQSIIVTGDYALHSGQQETSTITGHALLKQYFDDDTLFLHADTLRAVDEHPLNRKNEKDTSVTWRILYAYHKVKFFRADIQGKCDSLVYSSRDSIMRLYKSPVLWSEENQLTAEKVEIKIGGGKIMNMFLKNHALIVSKVKPEGQNPDPSAGKDSLMYNQIQGKQMTGYFTENELSKIFVEGNGQTIYFAKDKEKLIGVNKADCSNLMIIVKDNKVDKITFLKKPDATLFPMSNFNSKDFMLKGFVWREKERPLSMQDIFH